MASALRASAEVNTSIPSSRYLIALLHVEIGSYGSTRVCRISRFSSKYYILRIVTFSGEGDGTTTYKSSKPYQSLEPQPIEAILRVGLRDSSIRICRTRIFRNRKPPS